MKESLIKSLEKYILNGWANFPTIGNRPKELSFLKLSSNYRKGKLILLVFRRGDNAPLLITKMSRILSTQALLRNEYNALTKLHEILPSTIRETIPRPFCLGKINDYYLLTESPIIGRNIASKLSNYKNFLSKRAAFKNFELSFNWLISFRSQVDKTTSQIKLVKLEDCFESIIENYYQTLKPGKNEKCSIKALQKKSKGFLRETIPRLEQHGDFHPLNIIIKPNGDIGIIDWEYYGLIDFPLFDAFYFITCYLVDSCVPIVESSFSTGEVSVVSIFDIKWARGLISKYIRLFCQKIGLNPDLIAILYPYFILSQSIRMVEHTKFRLDEPEIQVWTNLFQKCTRALNI